MVNFLGSEEGRTTTTRPQRAAKNTLRQRVRSSKNLVNCYMSTWMRLRKRQQLTKLCTGSPVYAFTASNDLLQHCLVLWYYKSNKVIPEGGWVCKGGRGGESQFLRTTTRAGLGFSRPGPKFWREPAIFLGACIGKFTGPLPLSSN